jgi:O-antigen/teichoic acid export membrane protein
VRERQPDTDPLLDAPPADLGGAAVRSGTAKLLEQATLVVMSVGSMMVLARLLTPGDFGLIAMVAVLTALVQSLKHLGLPMATVHAEHLSRDVLQALFWLTLLFTGAAVTLLALAAPGLAWFFDAPQLVPITLALAVALLVQAVGVQHEAVLMRQMRFAVLARITVLATAGGVMVGIVAAVLGAAYWALVLQTFATSALLAAGHWSACRWRPGWRTSRAEMARARSLVGYGAGYSGFSVLEYVGRNTDRVLVGFFAGPAALGLYDNAYRWSLFPVHQIYTPLLGVAVSGLSRVARDAALFREYVRRSFEPVLAVTLPPLAFVVVRPEPVVRVLLGDQWLAAIPMLQILAVAAIVRCLTKGVHWLYLAEGRTRQQLLWAVVSTPVMIAGVAIGVRWGAVGVAYGFTAAALVLVGPEIAYGLHRSLLRGRDYAAAAWRPLAASGAAAAATAALAALGWLPAAPLADLLAALLAFCALYALAWVALPGGRAVLREIASLAQTYRRAAPPPRAPLAPPPETPPIPTLEAEETP